MYRNTYVDVNLKNIEDNVSKIIKKYNNYQYYFGVVKADSYGHNGYEVIDSIIKGGCNYLAVSSLDEALEIRQKFDIPILCLGIINEKYMDVCVSNNIDVTVTNLEYLKKIKDYKLNIHLKIDTGMNRLGVKDASEFIDMVELINNSNVYLKGIFTHIYKASSKEKTLKQFAQFKDITRAVDLSKIDIVHIPQSDTLVNYPKLDFVNGTRLGIIMYGLNDNNLDLKDTFCFYSEVIEIKKVKKGQTVSYDGIYKAFEDEMIGIVSAGYADGINRKLTGSYVYINNKKYFIIGKICMDMFMVKIDDKVKLHDKVYIYKDNKHIKYLSKYLDTIPYELLCNVSKRVPRKYLK